MKDGTVQTRSTAGTAQKKEETVSESNGASKTETSQVELKDLKPVDSYFYSAYKTGRTNRNALWSDVFALSTTYADSYAEYYVGGASCNVLEFEFAPKEGALKDLESVIEVYGDDDTLLWDSDTIGYKSAAQKATVDISGQEYIRINLHNEHPGLFSTSEVLIKNAVLK